MRNVGVQLGAAVGIADGTVLVELVAALIAVTSAQVILAAAAMTAICQFAARHRHERAFGPFDDLQVAHDKGVVEQAVALYCERFATKGMFENRIYSGIADALASLQLARVQLFVVTSKALLFAEPIVEHFGLRRLFRSVYGSELDGSYADKSELIAKVLRSESLTPSKTVMIGDRAHDVIGAKANGVFSVGALWGFGSRDELVSAGADLLCKTPNKLVETVCFR